MKLLSCVALLVVGGLLSTPCFSAEKKMKNEPKTIEGLACGDTPFKFFTPFEFIGRSKPNGCMKIYRKNGVEYNFNDKGQLFKVSKDCERKEIKDFTKEHGEATIKKKQGDDKSESITYEWNGEKFEASFYIANMNVMGTDMDLCKANYYCKKVEYSAEGDCKPYELAFQAGRVDKFVKALGNNVDFKELDKTEDRKTAELVAVFDKNAIALGLPKSETTSFEIRGDFINTVCMTYKKTKGSLIKKILHEKVGDISEDINNPIFNGTGKGSSIEYLDWDNALFSSSVGVRVCFTGVRG
jgi:hypothetical protein